MRDFIIQELQLPKDLIVNNHIPKKSFYENAEMTKSQVDLFTSDIEGVYLLAVMTPNQLNIPPYETEEYRYSEVFWIYASLRVTKHMQRIAETIHKSLPNPVVLIIGNKKNQEIALSTAHKRLNKQDDTKVVAEEQNLTHWFSIDPVAGTYDYLLENITVEKLVHKDLFEFYADINKWVKVERVIGYTGSLPEKEHRDDVIDQLNKIEVLEKEHEKLANEENEKISFGDKMQIHIQTKKLEKKIDNIKDTLKELC